MTVAGRRAASAHRQEAPPGTAELHRYANAGRLVAALSHELLSALGVAQTDVGFLCDLIEERARKRQTQFFPKAIVATDFRDVLARPEIEVVDIATHPRERLPLIEAALRAGKHVFMEKPMAVSVAAAEEILDASREGGGRLMVAYMKRYDAGNETAKAAILQLVTQDEAHYS